ncbi:amino acid adenylation domain-containing protein [Aeromonas sobria]|uniref:amino acid adenylation domain-containing protein n=1 Tax=Aeromonas sobria TaxID=646 RepID=UPI001C12B16F|nr:amino acid adenylation domain-containing protein [Aeromonas sobria]
MSTLLDQQKTLMVPRSKLLTTIDQPCLLTMLDSQVKMYPEHIAVQDCDSSIDYATFKALVAHNAQLINQHIKADEPCIGLYCDPSLDMITGAWSILASEHAYLPLAPEYPKERIRYMVADSGVRVILTQPHLKSQLESIVPRDVTVLTQAELQGLDKSDTIHTVERSVPYDNQLAYIIYTSGSSGKPKGVMVTYANVSHQIAFMKKQFKFNQHDRILQKTPASFDAAQWEILAPAFGSQVVVGPKDCYRDPDAMIDTLLNHDISILQCVPTLLQALVDHPLFTDCLRLNKVFSGGEILTRKLAGEFLQCLPHAELTNLYGPTECTINSSTFTLSRDALANYPDAISIGKPVANTLYHILREDGQPARVGEIGELHISGVQVAKGYYQRPDMTNEKFIANPSPYLPGHEVMYKTGDLVKQDIQGYTHFVGRADSQIKLRGYRVELDEIRLAIENHQWVKTAAMVVKNDPRTGHQNLIACVELDKRQAALMDQDNHDSHHQSKSNKLQVKAQLSNSGCRDLNHCDAIDVLLLPGKTATATQRANAFGRKTYRFFEGETPVSKAMLLSVLERQPTPVQHSRDVETLSLSAFGRLIRNFGQFISEERLLPKYAYASPGALYAMQMYFEIRGLLGITPGIYYYHPAEHCLIKIHTLPTAHVPTLNVHFIGKWSAIEPVYKNNLLEVLEMETGHMLGLFDELLPEHGLSLLQDHSIEHDKLPTWYDGESEDVYLGSYLFEPYRVNHQPTSPQYLVQIHDDKVAGLLPGLYQYQYGDLHWLTDQMLQKNDVIAINQKVFERSSFGIGLVCNDENIDDHYINLGRALHRLQSNTSRIGIMSSGYSSKTNNDLPAAITMRTILAEHGQPMKCLYFGVGGPISEAQYTSEGMNEDRVHMQGPTEILKDELALLLPQYMIPNKVLLLNKLPQTANGKVDYIALSQLDELKQINANRALEPLTTETEQKIGEIWCRVMKWESVSATDNFFESGGNSLTAVALVNRINSHFGIKMPLQVLFHTPSVSGLAHWIDNNSSAQDPCSRLVHLNQSLHSPVFCWPGLGGYPLNLKHLANELFTERAFYGVQAEGINADETPLASISDMAKADIQQIKKVQPEGPYTLWGYSFGARVAFEVAAQLEAMGETVEALYLLAPGAPITQMEREQKFKHNASFKNPVFLAILFSVFAHKVEGRLMERCLELCHSEQDFVAFICERFPMLEPDLVKRIIRIVTMTYGFSYQFKELKNRCLNAPVTIVKAQNDHYSFLEKATTFSRERPAYVELDADHYQVLKAIGVQELKQKLWATTKNNNKK